MLNKLKALLLEQGFSAKPDGGSRRFAPNEIAMAALLIEAAAADGDYSALEHRLIEDLLARKLKATPAEVAGLMALADERAKQSVQLYGFTRKVADALDAAERVALIEAIWEVVFSDGRLDDLEDQLVRRLAGLLHVSDRDRGEARKRVLARHGGQKDGSTNEDESGRR